MSNTPQSSKLDAVALTIYKILKAGALILLVLAVISGILAFTVSYGFWPLAMFLSVILFFDVIALVIFRIFSLKSVDMRPGKRLKIIAIVLAVLILPGWVILPVVGGIWDKYADERAVANYRTCMNNLATPNAPRYKRNLSKAELDELKEYYKYCENIRPVNERYYPE